MKEKDREMAKAINAEFSDDDDKDEDVESTWDEDDKVMFLLTLRIFSPPILFKCTNDF